MDFIPNAKDALQFITVGNMFARYAPAYIVTNELLRNHMAFMPKNCNNALTVAASGDHPLYCKLYGAKHVTTFDMTYNAKLVTDIKVAAIQQGLDIQEYRDLLNNLHRGIKPLSVPGMDRIISNLSPDIQTYMINITKAQPKFNLFSAGSPIDKTTKKYTLNKEEYQQIKNLITKPFDFIWSNVLDLQLTENYDFIHLSNIADYLSFEENAKVLINMLNHTCVNGCIVMQSQKQKKHAGVLFNFSECLCTQVAEKLPNWKLLSRGYTNILQRVR